MEARVRQQTIVATRSMHYSTWERVPRSSMESGALLRCSRAVPDLRMSTVRAMWSFAVSKYEFCIRYTLSLLVRVEQGYATVGFLVVRLSVCLTDSLYS